MLYGIVNFGESLDISKVQWEGTKGVTWSDLYIQNTILASV